MKFSVNLLGVVITNIFVGSLFFVLFPSSTEEVNFMLLFSMIFASVIVYIILFRTIKFNKKSYFSLFFISLLSCIAIVFSGNIINSVFFAYDEGFFLKIGNGLLLGVFGNIVMFPLIIVFSLINMFWFIKEKKYENQ